MFETPILFLIFNRPESTSQVFEAIRKRKPARLYIAADGPRENKNGEAELCIKTRDLVLKNIDWTCEVKTLLRNENLGCGRAVSEAISWFFEQEEEGIILEDDCLPSISFFEFCSQLLTKYRADEQVMSISGSNLLGKEWSRNKQSYFWGQGGIWGWASWRRAWKLYDYEMRGWEKPEIQTKVKFNLYTEDWFQYYKPMFDSTYKHTLDTWDIQWFYTILINDGFSINPKVNLVKNIGFQDSATHTSNTNSPISRLEINEIDFPLMHSEVKDVDEEYLKQMFAAIQNKRISNSLFSRLLSFFKRQ